MTFDASGFISGLAGVTLGGMLVGLWLRNLMSELRDLRNDIEDLKETRIAKLERRIDHLADECVGSAVQQGLKNLEGWMEKIDQNLARVAEKTAGQNERIAANKDFLTNLNASHREHTRDRELHQHG